MMRRVLAPVGQWIAACGGINDKTPSLSLTEDRDGAVAILHGARIGGQHWGLHPVVRGSIPRRSTFLSEIPVTYHLRCVNEYFKG